MATELRLPDGTLAIIWPLLKTDKEQLRQEYEHLSPESRYHRFLAAVPHLTDSMLVHLVDEVDGVNHMASVLFVLPDGVNGIPAAIGRIVRYADHPNQADAAVTVLDEWQRRGIATALLEELIRSRPADITQIVTDIAADNAAPLKLLQRLGKVTVTRETQGLLHVVVDLPEPTYDSPRGSSQSSQSSP